VIDGGPDLLLNATGIAKHYGAVVALRSASLAVRPGEVSPAAIPGGSRHRLRRPGIEHHSGACREEQRPG